MNVIIEINRSLKEQFVQCFKLDNSLCLDPSVGTGGPLKQLTFPGEMEFYHFQAARFAVPINMKTVNPPESDWFAIHINLGASKQRKIFAGQPIEFHKSLPIGMLIYGPGLEIVTQITPDSVGEFASIRVNKDCLTTYFENWREILVTGKSLILEDLDHRLESSLYKALDSMDNKIQCHAAVLSFLGQVFIKLQSHDKPKTYENLRPNEIDGLFRASALLRSPLAIDIPSVTELAVLANMGCTKFKSAFKQIFGSAPIRYRNRIRMEYAREQIISNGKTPTEISYLLGYSHPSNFTAAYKKQFGILPSAQVY